MVNGPMREYASGFIDIAVFLWNAGVVIIALIIGFLLFAGVPHKVTNLIRWMTDKAGEEPRLGLENLGCLVVGFAMFLVAIWVIKNVMSVVKSAR